jgi:hypothetical protein
MSDDLRRLQAALARLGLYRGVVDGIDGPLTKGAVRAAQRRFGLTPTGRADAALFRRLDDRTTGLAHPPGVLLRSAIGAAITFMKGHATMTFLAGYKTYIVAAMMLLAGLAGLLGIDVPSVSGQSPGDLILQALAFIFLRQGLKSGITKS